MESWLILTFLVGFSSIYVEALGVKFTTNTPFVLDYLIEDLTLSCQVPRAQNMNSSFVISLAISRSNNLSSPTSVIAEVSAYNNATLLDPRLAWTATGYVKNGDDASSFLEITANHPSEDYVGEYICEVDVLDEKGHTDIYSQSLVVLAKNVQPGDAAKYFVQQEMLLQSENMELQARKDALEKRVLSLEEEKARLQIGLQDLNQSSFLTQQDINALSNLLLGQSKLLESLSNIAAEILKNTTVTTITTPSTALVTGPYINPGDEVHLSMPDPKCTKFSNQKFFLESVMSNYCQLNISEKYCQGTCYADSGKVDAYAFCVEFIQARVCTENLSFSGLLTIMGMTCDNCQHVPMSFPNQEFAHELMEFEGCFSADSIVFTDSGKTKQMRDLEVEDIVLTLTSNRQLVFSEVYAFLHQSESQLSKFYTLNTEHGVAITLSHDHLVYVLDPTCASPLPAYTQVKLAENVKIGDILSMVNFGTGVNISAQGSRVVSKTVQFLEGVYSPLTMEGTIVVDNIIASCYAQCKPTNVDFVHFLFSPLQWSYKVRQFLSSWSFDLQHTSFSSWFPTADDDSSRLDRDGGDGVHWYAKMLLRSAPTIKNMKMILGL